MKEIVLTFAITACTVASYSQTAVYYQFDGAIGASPTNASDSGPLQLTATVVGPAAYAPGVISSGLDLSGDSNYVRIPFSTNLTFTDDWTIEFFFRAHQPYRMYGSDAVMLNKLNTANAGTYLSSYAVYLYSTGQLSSVVGFGGDTGASLSSSGGQNYADGNWHQLALTYKTVGSTNTLSLYADYALLASTNGQFPPIAWDNFPVYIGAGNFPNGNDTGPFRRNFDGAIDEFRLSTVALQPSQFIGYPTNAITAGISKIAGGIRVSCNTQTNRFYRIATRGYLTSGSWSNLGIWLGSGATLSVTNMYSNTVNQQFFQALSSP